MAATYYCADCFTTFSSDDTRCPNLSCGHARPEGGWGALLQPGELLDRHYLVGRPLAVGGAGITYLAREVDSEGSPIPPDLAIKVLYASRATGTYLRRLANEAQILQELDHDHIVKCRGFVQRTGHPPYLVTLFESGGNLAQHLEAVGPMSPRVAAATLRQVLLALDVAHPRGVVHRDLKPDNVLLRERVGAGEVPHVRVADFGIAKVAGGLHSRLTRVGTFLGTPEFAAPEQFRGETPTPATDVFAAGTLFVFLLTGQIPFAFTHRADLESSYRQMLDSLPLHPPLPKASPEERAWVYETLDHMHAVEPGRRWTLHQILARLAALVDEPTRAAYQTLDLTDRDAEDRVKAPSAETIKRPPPPTPRPPAKTAMKPAPEPLPAPPPPRGSRLLRLLAGLGAAGFVFTLVGGGVLTLGVWLFTAWSVGWLEGRAAPIRIEPIVLDLPEKQDTQVQDLRDQAVAWLGGDARGRAARAALTQALDDQGAELGRRCDLSARVLASVWLDAQGEVVHAEVEGAQGECIAEGLTGERFSNPTGAPGRARVAFVVGSP